MKIIQSYWSKPLLSANKSVEQNRFNGGWRNFRYCLLSMAYSCLTISRFYPEIELYTDDYGLKLLRDDLKLPYAKFHTDLNNINSIDPAFWAYGKIYTYSLQNKPFLHIDNDIFIWKKFSQEVMNAKVICQNVEWINPQNTNDYIDVMKYVCNKMQNVPDILRQSSVTYAGNMGIFGGNDIEFIHSYTAESMSCFNKMYDDMLASGNMKGKFNIIFEQLLLMEIAMMKGKQLDYLMEESDTSDISKYFTIESAQYEEKFVHCLGALKTSDFICEQIEYRMKYEYPRYYETILSYLDGFGMKFPENELSMEKYSEFSNVYSHIRCAKDREEIMNNYVVRLKDAYSVDNLEGKYFIVSSEGKRELKNWGKFLVFFNRSIKGEELSQYIYNENLLHGFTLERIRDCIFHLILQELYMTRFLEIV